LGSKHRAPKKAENFEEIDKNIILFLFSWKPQHAYVF